MKDNKLIEIARDLAKAIADSGDINVILFAFIFVVSIIAVVTAAAVEPLVLLSLIPLVIFFVWRIPSITRLGRMARTKERLLAHLQGICRATAQHLSLDASLVRSNIFMQSSDGMLRIVPGWHYNMDDRPAELTIEIPTGYGATGNAFQSRVAVIARARGGWGDHKLSPREMESSTQN